MAASQCFPLIHVPVDLSIITSSFCGFISYLYFLQAATRNFFFLQNVLNILICTLLSPHGELCTAYTAQLAVPCNHHTDYNILMYRALLNFLYSLGNKPLYFHGICTVLKKMQYTKSLLSCHFYSMGK